MAMSDLGMGIFDDYFISLISNNIHFLPKKNCMIFVEIKIHSNKIDFHKRVFKLYRYSEKFRSKYYFKPLPI